MDQIDAKLNNITAAECPCLSERTGKRSFPHHIRPYLPRIEKLEKECVITGYSSKDQSRVKLGYHIYRFY